MISTPRVKDEGRGFIASNLGVWLCPRADPRKLKREKVQNPTSAKIATLENFPLYGIHHTNRQDFVVQVNQGASYEQMEWVLLECSSPHPRF